MEKDKDLKQKVAETEYEIARTQKDRKTDALRAKQIEKEEQN